VRFEFELTGQGWAQVGLADDDGRIRRTQARLLSHPDPLLELLRAVRGLVSGMVDGSCGWQDEPGETRWVDTRNAGRVQHQDPPGEDRWVFSRDESRVHIEVRRLTGSRIRSPSDPIPDDVVFTCSTEVAELQRAVVQGASEALTRHGLDGYRALWGSELPVAELEVMRSQQPGGWKPGCRPEDRDWADSYGIVTGVAASSNPVEALPADYEAYTCILHPLTLDASEQRIPWLPDPEPDPWNRVEQVFAWARANFPKVTAWEGQFDPGSSAALIDLLDIEPGKLYTAAYFIVPVWREPDRVITMTGHELTAQLRSPDLCGPLMWWPHDRRWVVSTPYDEWWTYVASDQATADAIRQHPDLETLPCTHQA